MTHPATAGFYVGQLATLRGAGADVAFLSSPSREVARQCQREDARYFPIAMERAPAPLRDLRALAQLTATLARFRPHIVNAGTPKAGLLAIIAAATVRVPIRVHTIHGLRYEAATGAKHEAYWLAQRASCVLATDIVCVSRSLRERAIATGLFDAGRGTVIGDGTVNGIDTETFQRSPETVSAGLALRDRLGIARGSLVLGYLGRLSRDKGIAELADAWQLLRGDGRRLLVAGAVDETDPPDEEALALLRRSADVSLLGHVDAAAPFLAAIDVLALPTRREGFPTAPLEAAAMELPVVATRATGCSDAVVDGVTGTLVDIDDVPALASAIDAYFADASLRRRHGEAARSRVEARFSRRRVHELTLEFYCDLVATRASRRA